MRSSKTKTKTARPNTVGQEGKCVCGRKGKRDARGHATCENCHRIQKTYKGLQQSRAIRERTYFVDDNYDIRRGDKTLLDAALKNWECKQKLGLN